MHLSFIFLRFLFEIDAAFLLEMQWSKYANDFKLYSRRFKKKHTEKRKISKCFIAISNSFSKYLFHLQYLHDAYYRLHLRPLLIHSFIHCLLCMHIIMHHLDIPVESIKNILIIIVTSLTIPSIGKAVLYTCQLCFVEWIFY